jgi:transcriptional regulator with XRE-family HTH domain
MRTHKEVLASKPKHIRDAVARRVKEMEEEELSLRDLRKSLKITQTDLAETMGTSQSAVSQIENNIGAIYLATLRKHIEAMGGELQLVAKFLDRRPVIVSVADLTEEDDDRERKRA